MIAKSYARVFSHRDDKTLHCPCSILREYLLDVAKLPSRLSFTSIEVLYVLVISRNGGIVVVDERSPLNVKNSCN